MSSYPYNRQTIEEQLRGTSGVKSHKKVAYSTLVIEYYNGDKDIRFHNTDIVTFHPDESVTINCGGYEDSQITRERVQEYSKLYRMFRTTDRRTKQESFFIQHLPEYHYENARGERAEHYDNEYDRHVVDKEYEVHSYYAKMTFDKNGYPMPAGGRMPNEVIRSSS